MHITDFLYCTPVASVSVINVVLSGYRFVPLFLHVTTPLTKSITKLSIMMIEIQAEKVLVLMGGGVFNLIDFIQKTSDVTYTYIRQQ